MSHKPLAKYDPAVRALVAARGTIRTARHELSKARSVDRVCEIRNQWEGIRAYAKQAKDRSLELDASEVRIWAERRLGEMIDAQKRTVGLAKGAAAKGVGRRGKKRGSEEDPRSTKPTLEEAGIGKHLADRARKWAAMPKKEFERSVADWRVQIEIATERVTIKLLRPKQLELVPKTPLASSGRGLDRIIEINDLAPRERKLQDICEKIIKVIADGIRKLERLSAAIVEPGGVERFRAEFNKMESAVTALVQDHWEIHNQPTTDAPPIDYEPDEEDEYEEKLRRIRLEGDHEGKLREDEEIPF